MLWSSTLSRGGRLGILIDRLYEMYDLMVMCNIMLSIGKKNMMIMGTRTLIFGTVRRISPIGLGGKSNCGIKTMSELNSLILS